MKARPIVEGCTVHATENTICLIVIQHRERPGCGNTASGSAKYGRVRPCRFPPHLLSCEHQSIRASSGENERDQVHNPLPRTPGSCETVRVAALEPRWNWRERFRSGSSPPGSARIAITSDTVHPARGAAIVEVDRDSALRQRL